MSLWELFAGPSEPISRDPLDDFWYFPIRAKSASGIDVDDDVAMTYSACWAATRLLCVGTVLPLNVFRSRKGGGADIAIDHPVQQLIHSQPNDDMGTTMWRASRTAQQVNGGNGYSEILRDGRGIPQGLVPIHCSRVDPMRDKSSGRLFYRVRNDDTTSSDIPSEDMLHVTSIMSDDGIVGKGVVTFARETIGFGIATERQGAAYMKNSARPAYAIIGGSFKDDAAREYYRKTWVGVHGGPENNAKPALLPTGATLQALGFSQEDSQFLGTRQHNVEEICRWYGTPPHMVQHLLRATYCLPASEPVFTSNGPVSIADVKPGDLVWSWAHEGGWRLSPVVASICSGVDAILEIKTRNRVLRCNAKHPVLTRKKFPAPRSGLGGYQCVEWKTMYVPAGELKQGDIIVLADGMIPDQGNTTSPTGRELTEEFMEFCGLMIGDGWFSPKTGVVAISRSPTASYMDHYRSAMKRMFRSGNRITQNRNYPERHICLSEEGYTTRFSSKNLTTELVALGFSGTAHTKQIPGWLFGIDAKLRLAFLRGYLDADGHVDKNGEIVFRSCNERLLEGVRHLCIGLGIAVGKIRCHEGVKTLPNGKVFAFRNYCLGLGCARDNERIGTHDTRYQQRFAQNASKPKKRLSQFGWKKGHDFSIPGCELATISSIDSLPPEPVYDLEVKGTHSFVANGVVVHNSNIEHQGIDFVVYALLPWLKLWEDACNIRLLTPAERRQGYFIKHNVEGLLRGDRAARASFYQSLWQMGVLSINEIRDKEDLNPIGPDGDKRFVQTSYATVDKISTSDWKAARDKNDVGRDEFREHVLGLKPSPVKEDAPLLSLVGGLTGTGDVSAKVGRGEMNKEAASELIQMFFNIDKEKADKIAGDRMLVAEGNGAPFEPESNEASSHVIERLASLEQRTRMEFDLLKASLNTAPLNGKSKEATDCASKLLRSTIGRMLNKEARAAEAAAKNNKTFSEFVGWLDGYYADYRETFVEIVSGYVEMLLLANHDERDPIAVSSELADQHIALSREHILQATEVQQDRWCDVPGRIHKAGETWQQTRTTVSL